MQLHSDELLGFFTFSSDYLTTWHFVMQNDGLAIDQVKFL